MHSLSQNERSKIHAVYVALYKLPYTLQRKTMLLTALMGGAEWSWRVVGVTPGALEVLEANNYKYSKGKICRAHLTARMETARSVFEISQPLPEDEFFRIIWEKDETIIATKPENKPRGSLPKPVVIDYERGLFRCNPLVGWKHGKQEADYLRELHTAYKSRKPA